MSESTNPPVAATVMVPLANIPTEEGVQTRVKVCAAVARDYAAAMKLQIAEGGLRFPPITLFRDGEVYWLGDGCHRVLAARKAGLTEIAAEVHAGTRRDALLFAIAANSAHGLPRSRADRRKAVALILADAEWSQWSDSEIARRCQVVPKVVTRMRPCASSPRERIEKRKVQRGDTVYEMKVAPSAEAASQAPAATDPPGIPLTEPMAKIFAARGDFEAALRLIDQLAPLLDQIARGPAGELYRQEMTLTANNGAYVCAALRHCRAKLVGAEPFCGYCPNCYPTHPTRAYPGCKKCGGRGWTTQPAFESCQTSDRERILKMRDGKI